MASSSYLATSLLTALISVLPLLPRNYVLAAEHTVGDEGRWDQGVNYLSWSQKYNFTVGDVLVFNYVKGQHNVYQVTKDTYQSCDSSSGVVKTYISGNDRVMLTEAMQYWFICNTNGHCKGGMRFGIKVKKSNADEVPSMLPPVSSPDVFPSPLPAAGHRMGKGRWWTGCGWRIVLGLLAFI